jgi:hypothetical protein
MVTKTVIEPVELVLGCTVQDEDHPEKGYKITSRSAIANSQRFIGHFVRKAKEFVSNLDKDEVVGVDIDGDKVTLRVSPVIYDQMLPDYGELVCTCLRDRSWD